MTTQTRRLTEAEAARIEARIERLRAADAHEVADSVERRYWDRCNLSADVRAQLEAKRKTA